MNSPCLELRLLLFSAVFPVTFPQGPRQQSRGSTDQPHQSSFSQSAPWCSCHCVSQDRRCRAMCFSPFCFPKEAGMLTPASWTWQHSSAASKIWPSRHCFTPNERTLLQPLFRGTLCLGSSVLKMVIRHQDRTLCVGFGCLDIGF